MDDQTLRHPFVEELEWAPHVDATYITVDVQDGIVRFGGVVASLAEKHAAERAVWDLHGVRARDDVCAIENQIAICPETIAADIAANVRRAFARHAGLDAARITVAVDGSTVALTGTVRSMLARHRIENAAWPAAGVGAVDNRPSLAP